ncbi:MULTISPECIES: EAL domain-containing protein [unclassified Roseateles]|uniref:EAL domain-containing response regulator n=1 Tax=unclassified Roseateles TaxID=2626991 RepID=UPI0007015DDA|nr:MULTISPECIES: EAL domain-containing response regulator [unclassified Roseateles]KQW51495.1 two-component response regulator [Pelomonas sp. Root405]KRA77728.1 two-component response regulator [Pelomonas sp. Root662]
MSSMGPDEIAQLVALVVEDSAVQRNQLVSLVRDLKIGTVLEADDGLEALRLLKQQAQRRIFLVITDVDMPGMDGIELIGHLAEGNQVENLIVTSACDPRLLETVESMGAGDERLHLLGTLPKPVTAAGLARLLNDARSRTGTSGRPPFEPDHDDICRGLSASEFIPFFQPKVSFATGLVTGVEALARWRHPEHGLLGPQAFIPLMEGTPLMGRFTLSIVEQGLRQLNAWTEVLPLLTLSLNLAADDLADQRFVDQLTELVARHGAKPASVTWEVTETMLMNGRSMANLARLGLKGFGLSMDDYGIGYSSMQTLSRSPFTELKIDRAFVTGASERSNRRAILMGSLDIGRRLGVCTVAEGVETTEDWRLLAELGCEMAQGYLIAKPMPAAELLSWIPTHRARLRALAAPIHGSVA